MRNVRVELAAAALIACFGASLVLACAIEFPWQLLDNRAETLNTMPVDTNSFKYAEEHLFPQPKDRLTAVEPEYSSDAPDSEVLADELAKAEADGLSSEQAKAVRQMRAQGDGEGAYNQGGLLPASIRLYTAGAVDFHKKLSAKAIERFEAVLRLPAEERQAREVWAAYMLGRIYASKGHVPKASHWFAATRDFVNQGAPDPLGLGVTSFGEEARSHLDRARSLSKVKNMTVAQRREYGREYTAAIRLYAEQTAHRSSIGQQSLRQVVDEVLSNETAFRGSICDPIVQQLLVERTLVANTGEEDWSYPRRFAEVASTVQKCGDHVAAADQLAAIAYHECDFRLAGELARQSTTPLATWVKARLAMQKGDVPEAVKYYAEASQAFATSGDSTAYDESAKALLVGENSVLTLSRGEYVDALEQLYPYAATYWGDVSYIAERVLTVDELKTFVDTHQDTQMKPPNSLRNLPVSDGDSVDWFFSTEDKDPAAHMRSLLARRLVRAQRYQEALRYLPPAATAAPTITAPTSNFGPVVTYENLTYENRVPKVGTVITREGIPRAVGGAVGPFPSAVGISIQQNQQQQSQRSVSSYRARFGGPPSKYAPWVKFVKGRRVVLEKPTPEGGTVAYVEALNQAQAAKSEVERARAWYTAATLAADFQSGAEIMGTEGKPDYAGNGGSFTGGVGPWELKPDDPFVSEGERQRYKASAAKPDFRYHYLFVGTDEAIHAADLLPARSQAFAAVMCNATSWMMDGGLCPASASDLRALPTYASDTRQIANPITSHRRWRDEDLARINLACQLYQRYLKEGAVVPWAKYFGRGCPDPDFDSAVTFTQRQEVREAHHASQVAHHRRITAMKLALILAVWAVATWWFVRHRYA